MVEKMGMSPNMGFVSRAREPVAVVSTFFKNSVVYGGLPNANPTSSHVCVCTVQSRENKQPKVTSF